MKSIALFSGGKDSTYAIYLAMQQGYEIEKLVTIYPSVKDSFMYHIPMIDRTELQARAMGIERDVHRIDDSVDALKNVLSQYDVDAVISGAIASNFQKTKIEEVCTELGVLSFAPLWGKSQELLLRDMLAAGLKIMIIGVYAYGLDASYLGEIISEETLKKLKKVEEKYQINLAGEGGEYETFVVDAPHFKSRIEVEIRRRNWDGVRGELEIENMHLVPKR
ncbi:MAG: diphthine--ammonia ligase [Euryarchaeota archaeon]|nr:diphthine--ammonia ligase [Euryarchaeota archaeon]